MKKHKFRSVLSRIRSFLSRLLHILDPHKQSVFYFKTNFFDWLVFLMVCIFLYANRKNLFVLFLLYNPFFAYPNVYVHSFLGHMFLGPVMKMVFVAIFGFVLPETVVAPIGEILLAGSGSFSEILLPCIGMIICLRIAGGRYVLPVALYWLSVSIFNVGLYIVNPSSQLDLFAYNPAPSACALMVELGAQAAPQVTDPSLYGDWAFILNTLGLQAYAQPIGHGLMFLATAGFVLAVWSPFYYWRHMDQYPIPYCEFW